MTGGIDRMAILCTATVGRWATEMSIKGREGTVAETGTRVEAETDTDAGSPGYWG